MDPLPFIEYGSNIKFINSLISYHFLGRVFKNMWLGIAVEFFEYYIQNSMQRDVEIFQGWVSPKSSIWSKLVGIGFPGVIVPKYPTADCNELANYTTAHPIYFAYILFNG